MIASAYDFEADGVFYNITSIEKRTVEVTYSSEQNYQQRKVVIPSEVEWNGYLFKVEGIGYWTFSKVNFPNNVDTLIISSGVKYIRDNAFQRANFSMLSIPNTISSVDINTFSNISAHCIDWYVDDYEWLCSSGIFNSWTAKNIYVNNVKLTEDLVIPNGVKYIEARNFAGLDWIKTLYVSKSVEYVDAGAFSECNNLETVVFEEGVKEIYGNSYRPKPGFAGSTFGSFENCPKLCKLTLPSSIIYLGDGAFINSPNLKEINSYINNPFPISSCFSNGQYLSATLNIPYDSKSKYQSVDGWKNFINIIESLTPVWVYHSISFSVSKGGYIQCNDILIDNQNAKYDILEGEDAQLQFIPEVGHHLETLVVDNNEVTDKVLESRYVIKDVKSDVSISAVFDTNKYKLTYIIDGNEYKSYELDYGANITPEAEPMKEGYTFSGWGEIPETMPAHDVTVTGTFTINKYKLTYIVDGQTCKTYDVEYGSTITPEAEPMKEGYTFSGWSEIPETMPAHDVTVTGTFTINKYKLTYTIDGEEYKSYKLDYRASITPEAAPTREGYTFSGWSEIPEAMPAHDVTVTGSFTINSYKLTYMIDDKVYKETMYEYGATITPESQPEGDYATFEWIDLPQTMPAHDVIVYASYTSGIIEVLMTTQRNICIYSPNGKKLDKLQKGLNIVVLDDGTVKKVVVK